MRFRFVPLLAAALIAAATAAHSSGAAPAGPSPAAPAPDKALHTAIAGKIRPAADRVRDPARHPYETLQFWGIKPGLTVVDLQPEGGYWTEILAPYLARTNGTYIAGVADFDDPKLPGGLKVDRRRFEAKHADTRVYGQIRYAAFGAVSGPLAPPASVDVVISAREFHNWVRLGFADKAVADAFAALKPGGIFAVEDHRAEPKEAELTGPGKFTGYIATQTVIDAATKAGFVLDAASEINANPRDTKDQPFGVWTLPPARRSDGPGHAPLTDAERARYDAIGESDRMTLRFRKPL